MEDLSDTHERHDRQGHYLPSMRDPDRWLCLTTAPAIGAGILATLVALFLIAGWLDHQAGSRMREAEQARQIEERSDAMTPSDDRAPR